MSYIEKVLENSQSIADKDSKMITQTILLDEELNSNVVDAELMEKALHIRSKIHEAMCKGISNQEASDLLEQYDEIDNGIHEAEREHWLKVGIRIGYEFFSIINKSSQL